MLSNEALRVLAAANEALEARKEFLKSMREKIAALPKENKDGVRRLLAEVTEFDNSFNELFTGAAKKEPETR